MKKYLIPLILLFMILFASCKTSPVETELPNQEFTSTPEATNRSTETPFITRTSIPQTVPPSTMPTRINTVTPTLDAGIIVKCLQVTNSVPGSILPAGRLVLQTYKGEQPVFLDLPSLNSQPITPRSGYNITSVSMSRENNWVAYMERTIQNNSVRLTIIGSQNKYSYQLDTRAESIAGWIDENHILINMYSDPVYSLISLEITNGKNVELSPVLPDIWNVTPKPDWNGFALSEKIYDPFQKYLLYPYNPPDHISIAIWDIHADKIVAEVRGTEFFSHTPIWSMDGKHFFINKSLSGKKDSNDALMKDQELFSVDVNGNIDQLTHFTLQHNYVRIGSFSLSPESKLISFWVDAKPSTYPEIYGQVEKEHTQRLAVVNIEDRQVIDYCLPGDIYSTESIKPVWSPDGKWLVVDNRQSASSGVVYLVDLSQGIAYPIGKDAYPTGWLDLSK